MPFKAFFEEVKSEMEIVSVKNLRKCYGREIVIDGWNFMLEDGEFVTIMGPTGCGKTTFLRIIAGLEDHEGEVELRAKKVGFVFQDDRLVPWLNALENVLFVCEDEKKALESLDLVGLSEFSHLFPPELSGGMKKLLGFARAICIGPDLLILDEPFSSIDFHLKRKLTEILRNLKGSVSVILVTHSLEEAEELSDRIIVVSKRPSRILGELPREKLLKDISNFIEEW